jgi:2-desacetyl-2-hydroxyethyl bacteriochlorophyllide A dehydrogenase
MQTKRILFEQPGHVTISTTESQPIAEKPTELVVRNLCSLVSPGTELACLTGRESWFPLPGTPGYAAVGEILTVGASVSRFVPGDRVLTHGPHASYFTIDTADRYTGTCVKVPADLPSVQAVFARMASIALAAIRTAHIELGDRVLVTGLGLVGNFAAQFAALQGATVIATDPCEKRRQAAQACGLADCVDAAAADWCEQVKDLLDLAPLDCFIDATGLSSVITEAATLLAPRGEAILLGTPRQPWSTDVTEIYQRIHLHSSVRFKGALEWLYPTFKDEFTKHSVERNTEVILELILQGRLKVAPLRTHQVAPERAPEIYAGLRERKDDYLGVAFDWI